MEEAAAFTAEGAFTEAAEEVYVQAGDPCAVAATAGGVHHPRPQALAIRAGHLARLCAPVVGLFSGLVTIIPAPTAIRLVEAREWGIPSPRLPPGPTVNGIRLAVFLEAGDKWGANRKSDPPVTWAEGGVYLARTARPDQFRPDQSGVSPDRVIRSGRMRQSRET